MIIIHDFRLPPEYCSAIKRQYPAHILCPFDMSGSGGVYDSISSHPDIYFFTLDNNTLVSAPCVPGRYLNRLKESGIRSVRGSDDPGPKYPGTALYNAVRVDGKVFHNTRHTDRTVKEQCVNRSLEPVHCEQGYARCSTMVCGERALVTADTGLARSAGKAGVEALLVSPGHVRLPGEKYGFIGGACGIFPDGTVLVLGDLRYHPDADEIRSFFKARSVALVELQGLPLYDAGSVIICGE